MNTRLRHVWDKLTSSYWFVPAILMCLSALLAFGALYLDRAVLVSDEPSDWLYGGGVEGARTLLSTVAGSIVTVAGVVFSITVAALTQASSQFGPRLLRSFMRDTGNQVVLGTFVSTFLYCILVLRALPEPDAGPVPHLSVTLTVALAVASLCVLVYFIDHISTSMQAPHVVARAAAELRDVVRRRYPTRLGHPEPSAARPETVAGEAFGPHPGAIEGRKTGYVQAVDEEELLRVAADQDLRLELLVQPGSYVSEGDVVAHVWPARQVGAPVSRSVDEALLVGRQRTSEQDVEHALGQLVEIAVRALSPGVNDPFTAMTCLDWLGDGIRQLADCDACSPLRVDDEGISRVFAPSAAFASLVAVAFDQVREYGRGSVSVTLRLLDVLAGLSRHVRTPAGRAALVRQARLVEEDSARLPSSGDRAEVRRRCRSTLHALLEPSHTDP